MKGKRKSLRDVTNATGRVDVALVRIAERVMERLEREQGILGLREHLLPVVEQATAHQIPAVNMLPRELFAIIRVCEANKCSR